MSAKLLTVQLETNHHNSDGVAWYAYFDGKPNLKELKQVYKQESLWEKAPLGRENCPAEEAPNLLSAGAGLRRYLVASSP